MRPKTQPSARQRLKLYLMWDGGALVWTAPLYQGVTVEGNPTSSVDTAQHPVHLDLLTHRHTSLTLKMSILWHFLRILKLGLPQNQIKLTLTVFACTPCPVSSAGRMWQSDKIYWWWSTRRWKHNVDLGPEINIINLQSIPRVSHAAPKSIPKLSGS